MERPAEGADPIRVKFRNIQEYELYQFVGKGKLLALVAESMGRY